MTPTTSLAHPLVQLVTASIRHLVRVAATLPFLLAVVEETKRIFPDGVPVSNDIALRLFLNSYDMLVIDLCSLRERAIVRSGMFSRLRQHCAPLGRIRPEDFDPEWMLVHALAHCSEGASFDRERQRLADDANRCFDWLFPAGEPVTEEHIDTLIGRFRADMNPTAEDRNRARAHRYEHVTADPPRYVQTLAQAKAQAEVFKNYFRSLFSVLDGSTYPTKSRQFLADTKATAGDLADIIVLGSINEAAMKYGAVTDGCDYRSKRSRFLGQRGRMPRG